MFIYLLYLLGIVSLYLFIRLRGDIILRQEISYRYRRWLCLNNLVSTQHRTALSIFSHSLRLLCRVFYISLLQYLNSSVIRLGTNQYIITYVVNGKLYRLLVKPKRGPSPVIQVINEEQEDVTSEVLPYMGPCYNWHNNDMKFNSFFNSETLTFNMSSGNEITCISSKKLQELSR